MTPWQLTPWTDVDIVIRLLVAAGLGGLVGYERYLAEKPAGLRTNILVCTGAALFTAASLYAFGPLADTSRVAAGIVVGVGFLGAGSIMRRGGEVTGLTTAATIWVVAAIGLVIGVGLYVPGLVTAGITFFALRLPHRK
ncbi:MAG: MgtC/SapB family protein [Chloroflexi bacterium]|nr:MgtC/SapB family protein [Chloroflexota bacterium]